MSGSGIKLPVVHVGAYENVEPYPSDMRFKAENRHPDASHETTLEQQVDTGAFSINGNDAYHPDILVSADRVRQSIDFDMVRRDSKVDPQGAGERLQQGIRSHAAVQVQDDRLQVNHEAGNVSFDPKRLTATFVAPWWDGEPVTVKLVKDKVTGEYKAAVDALTSTTDASQVGLIKYEAAKRASATMDKEGNYKISFGSLRETQVTVSGSSHRAGYRVEYKKTNAADITHDVGATPAQDKARVKLDSVWYDVSRNPEGGLDLACGTSDRFGFGPDVVVDALVLKLNPSKMQLAARSHPVGGDISKATLSDYKFVAPWAQPGTPRAQAK